MGLLLKPGANKFDSGVLLYVVNVSRNGLYHLFCECNIELVKVEKQVKLVDFSERFICYTKFLK